MTMDIQALLSSIRAGEDTELELKEVVFRGDRIAFGSDPGRASSKLAEAFVSMANTRGGTLVMGVRNADRVIVGVDPASAISWSSSWSTSRPPTAIR